MSATCPRCGRRSRDRVVDDPVDRALMIYRCSAADCPTGAFVYRKAGWIP